jgi:malonate-semialdehyde dehydrogenase (acetylating)/methylmalonate-semialdehyde dehydrogenase
MTIRMVPNVIAGLDAGADAPLAFLDVFNPANGKVIAKVPMSGAGEVDLAVREARAAFPAWSATPIKERVQVFYRYKALLEQHIDELTALVTEENGKIASEARAEVLKSAELTEFACSLPQIVTGEVLEVSRGVECRVERFPQSPRSTSPTWCPTGASRTPSRSATR